jgi:putative transposase
VANPTTSPITANPRVRKLLEQIIRHKHNKAILVERAKVILKLLDGSNNTQAAKVLGLHRGTTRDWRRRWLEAQWDLQQAEALIPLEDDDALLEVIEEILEDLPRSGTPTKFSPEQIVQIIAVGCEDPQASGYTISHWTPSDLAREVVKRGIVESISARSVGRFLKAKPKLNPISRATGSIPPRRIQSNLIVP